ncbi:uncharacterized protein Z518_08008 [Rhinocladiella mackenziei CBS 650.93]|uniref:Rhinocladiella mackenziei CBS 650.93 unplaced genomic scaffold supercont1.6, whole genome shotgun sequence n=1 Tax=Rhinocladiella mackenziei CBS 650.93 TaxID=1442369 RepID=A0A0D2I897_9EURO|nr:uncharacterized protein Z518_08008 [Rhinocladiella mackenziei CBS 650.93]KIX02069.1 hypothetical protein Z518_08008 [Rhinocladiella mackenziei CBS 650.93]
MGLREVTFEDERPLQEIADTLVRSHKILLITGAGISTSCGIPDFRSKDGLYNIIPEQATLPTPPPSEPSTPSLKRTMSFANEELPSPQSSTSFISSRTSSTSMPSKLRGQDLFDSRVFHNPSSTTIFYQFIAHLREKIRGEVRSTSSVHKFVRVLRDGGRLMRCYTQNIDGLESREGLVTDLACGKGNKRRFMKKNYEAPRPAHTSGTDFDSGCEVVQLHGDLEKLRCTMCSTPFAWTDAETEIYLEGAAPKCPQCQTKSEDRQATGKRGLTVGSLRPNIVLYGEDHPSNTLLTPLIPFDAGCQPEVMIIMGTSLKVFGLQKIVREFAKAVHAHKNGKGRVIFVNRTRPAESVWEGIIDDFVAMDCDDWVEDLKHRRPDLWLRQGDIGLAVSKSTSGKKKRKSIGGEARIENRPIKKAKVVVEIPGASAVTDQGAPSTPSTKPLKPPPNCPGRAILSPLAQARRPSISPLSSPVRPDDTDPAANPARRSTPKRPAFSPLTPASKLKMGVLRDKTAEQELFGSKPVRDNPEVQESSDENAAAESMLKDGSRSTNQRRESSFIAQIWQRVRDGHILSCSRPLDVSEGSTENGVMEVDTPSRGPRGRKIDVFTGRGWNQEKVWL